MPSLNLPHASLASSPPPGRSPMEGLPLDSAVILLHGDLDICILEARCLPNMDLCAQGFSRVFIPCGDPFGSRRGGKEEEGLAAPRNDRRDQHFKITSDPYVVVRLAGAAVARTRVISNAEFPVWNQHFVVPVAHSVAFVEFEVKDNDVLGAESIGTVKIPAIRVVSGELLRQWFPVYGPSGKPPKPGTALLVSLKYKPVESEASYIDGIAGDPQKSGVQGTYFPLRKGGRVTLYQDAHVNDGDLPEIKLDDGKVFEHSKCWEDICQAILEAHHLIYIVGWSIYHKVKLVREPSTGLLMRDGEKTLGDLLKYKSQEGVRVCLLVWDDRTSHHTFFFKTGGVMQTHDEETRKFFKNSSVTCILSPRYASSKLSFIKQQIVGNLFTHHQKCVLVDTEATESKRRITAFIGGLDLCDGRYDTPQHRLFCDLDTVFLNDFRNPTFAAETEGPRQPWHDMHCKIEGPAAHDILKNFEQRWRKATKWWDFRLFLKRESHYRDDVLLKLERVSWIISPSPTVPEDDPSLRISEEDDPKSWHVQVFRSIDSGSVKGFPDTANEAEKQNLTFGKNLTIDKSIHTAYVNAIRSAKHFIYIENQYFIGSSYAWPSYKNPDADNLIPMELALKISSKIRAKERFAVYIVIPMWPEGVPTSPSVQEILYWQRQTVQMMYEIIAQELKSMNVEQHPQDYLNFYCLGRREPEETWQFSDQDSAKNAMTSSQRNRRFMIYVHAKGMIVDDEYVILGSANINQRSLDGSRDTEIAMGAYQPHHTWAEKNRHPHGQVYGYRMSLWAEHLGISKEVLLKKPQLFQCFEEPHELECVKTVNSIAEQNWWRYTSEGMTPLQGHLLKYPINVDADGKVEAIPGQEDFPDVGGKVLGAETSLPDLLTM